MVKKTVKLDQKTIFDDVRIIGITPHLVDYKIALALNRRINVEFHKMPDIAGNNNVLFPFFSYQFTDSDTSYNLIGLCNKTLGINWLGQLPIKIDYLLILRGDDATDRKANDITSKMLGEPNITIYQIKDNINSTMKKIYDKIEKDILATAELHECSQYKEIKPLKSNLDRRQLNAKRA